MSHRQFSVRGGKKPEDVHVISCQTLKRICAIICSSRLCAADVDKHLQHLLHLLTEAV